MCAGYGQTGRSSAGPIAFMASWIRFRESSPQYPPVGTLRVGCGRTGRLSAKNPLPPAPIPAGSPRLGSPPATTPPPDQGNRPTDPWKGAPHARFHRSQALPPVTGGHPCVVAAKEPETTHGTPSIMSDFTPPNPRFRAGPNNVDSLTRLHALSLRSVSAKGAHSYDGGPSADAGHDDGYHATNWTQRSGPVGRPTPGVEANDPRLETSGD